jgi:hypothetical protein
MFKKLMIGVLATAMLATGGTLAFAGDGGNDGDDDDGDVIRLTSRTVSEGEIDLGEAGFGPGDRFFFAEDLLRGGERVGESGGECVIVRVEGQDATGNCVATLSLPAGQITLQGLITFTEGDPPFTVAVTGGTGRYRDADGEATIETVSETEDRFTIRLD